MRIQDLAILLAFVIATPLQAQTQSTSETHPAKTDATLEQERIVPRSGFYVGLGGSLNSIDFGTQEASRLFHLPLV
jgi:hypothetical protein